MLYFLFSNLQAEDLTFKFGKDGDGNYGYYGADGSLIPFKKTVVPNIVSGASNTSSVTYTPDWENFNRIHVAYTCENYYCFCSFDENGSVTGHYSRWGSYPVSFKNNSDGTITLTGSGGSSPNHISIIPYNV